MAIRDIVVHVDEDPACPSRMDVATALAAIHDAHLTGLHVWGWPPVWISVERELPPGFLEAQRQDREERARRLEEQFTERTRRRLTRTEWRATEGDITETVRLHARYADLTVVGQGLGIPDPPAGLASLPEELALGVGRPILVVPRYGTFPSMGEQVIVAWNGSREATRAVHDALPLLMLARRVTVLSVDPDERAGPRLPGADLALHLARHGIRAEAATTVRAGLDVGDVLLSQAADRGADLIVMGAYGRSRLREVVLGGVTRHLLQHLTVPVLMSR